MGNLNVFPRYRPLTRAVASRASIIFDCSERICFILFIDTKKLGMIEREILEFPDRVFSLAICNQPHFTFHDHETEPLPCESYPLKDASKSVQKYLRKQHGKSHFLGKLSTLHFSLHGFVILMGDSLKYHR